MMRGLSAFALLLFMLPAHAAINWSDLWRNPDQQGEVLLQHGDAAAAARVYKDTRRKAYAELKAGDYAAAVRDLAAFDDTDANYNRGNALAYAGDLQGAINAYDAALKRDPHNQDAIHNREMIENALKQQPPKQQDANSDKSKDGKSGGQNGSGQSDASQGRGKQGDQSGKAGKNGRQGQSSANNQGQAGNKSGQGRNSSGSGNSQQQGSVGDKSKQGEQAGQDKGGNSGQQGKSSANSPAQTGTAGDKSGNSQNPAAQGTSGNPSMQQGEQNGKGEADRQAAHTSQDQGRNDAEQARRDAAASLTYAASDKQGGKGGGNQALGNEAGSNGARQSTPISEQQLAQEQWLHSIPDDPGGLLRRKFMIEHMMRQQKVQR